MKKTCTIMYLCPHDIWDVNSEKMLVDYKVTQLLVQINYFNQPKNADEECSFTL